MKTESVKSFLFKSEKFPAMNYFGARYFTKHEIKVL